MNAGNIYINLSFLPICIFSTLTFDYDFTQPKTPLYLRPPSQNEHPDATAPCVERRPPPARLSRTPRRDAPLLPLSVTGERGGGEGDERAVWILPKPGRHVTCVYRRLPLCEQGRMEEKAQGFRDIGNTRGGISTSENGKIDFEVVQVIQAIVFMSQNYCNFKID